MIINSPVGRFPFTITSVSLRRTGFLIKGKMGTWPATLEGTAGDIPAAIGRVSPAVAALLVVAALVLVGIGTLAGALLL